MRDDLIRAILCGFMRRDFTGWDSLGYEDGLQVFRLGISKDVTVTASVDTDDIMQMSFGAEIRNGAFSCDLSGLDRIWETRGRITLTGAESEMTIRTGRKDLDDIMTEIRKDQSGPPMVIRGRPVPVWTGGEALEPEDVRLIPDLTADEGAIRILFYMIHGNDLAFAADSAEDNDNPFRRHYWERGPTITLCDGLVVCVNRMYGTETCADILMTASYESKDSPLSFEIRGIPRPGDGIVSIASPESRFVLDVSAVPESMDWTSRTSSYLRTAPVAGRSDLAAGREDRVSWLMDRIGREGAINRSSTGEWRP